MTTGFYSIDVKVGFGSGPFASAPTMTSLIGDVLGISITRGRTSPLSPFAALSATVTLDNTSRKYDPKNGAGPYAGQFDRRSPVTISALDSTNVRRNLCKGVIAPRGWHAQYPYPTDAVTTLEITDLLMFLAPKLDTSYPTFQYAGDLSGSRVIRILNLAGITSAFRQVDPGLTVLQGTTLGKAAREELQLVEDSEGGAVYVDKDGLLRFDDRGRLLTDPRMTISQATFSDAGGTDVPMTVLDWRYDDICNDATVGRFGGPNWELTDATSIASNGPAPVSRTSLQMQNDPEAYARAELLVDAFSSPRYIPTTIEIDPFVDGDLAVDQALRRELRDRATVTFHPPGGGTANSADVFIEQIQHQIDAEPQPSWRTRLQLSAGNRFDFAMPVLILDDATNGLLDTNRLAF